MSSSEGEDLLYNLPSKLERNTLIFQITHWQSYALKSPVQIRIWAKFRKNDTLEKFNTSLLSARDHLF